MWPAHHERRQKRDSLRERTAGSGLQRQVCFSVNSCSCPTLKECHNIIIRGKKKKEQQDSRGRQKTVSLSHNRISPVPALGTKPRRSVVFHKAQTVRLIFWVGWLSALRLLSYYPEEICSQTCKPKQKTQTGKRHLSIWESELLYMGFKGIT